MPYPPLPQVLSEGCRFALGPRMFAQMSREDRGIQGRAEQGALSILEGAGRMKGEEGRRGVPWRQPRSPKIQPRKAACVCRPSTVGSSAHRLSQ